MLLLQLFSELLLLSILHSSIPTPGDITSLAIPLAESTIRSRVDAAWDQATDLPSELFEEMMRSVEILRINLHRFCRAARQLVGAWIP